MAIKKTASDNENHEFTEHYYCPLTADIFLRDEYGDMDEDCEQAGGDYPASYKEEIDALIERGDSLDDRNLAEYFDGRSSAVSKLRGIYFGTEECDGVLYGCIRADLTEKFTPEEESEFMDYLIGQCSDGNGEGLEQRPIAVEDGEMYVSFWNSDSSYFMMNEDQFDEYRINMEMEGPNM